MALITSVAASLKNTWGFSPQSIPSLQLWLDGADTTSMTFSSGTSNVTTWRDKSGNGYNATNGTYAAPTYSATGFNTKYPGLLFNGTSTMLSTPSILPTPVLSANGTDTTIFVVFNRLGLSPNSGVFGLGGAPGPTTYNTYVLRDPWANSDYSILDVGTLTSGRIIIVNTAAIGPQIYSLFRSGTSTYFYKYGVSVGSNLSSTGNVGTTSQPLNIGGGFADSVWFNSYISEFIIFNTCLTTPQRQQVEGYLAAKWGLNANLPATHPYSTTASIPFNRPFYPTDIGGCLLWLDAADKSSIVGTSPVTSWVDKSGNVNNGTTANGTPALITSGTTPFIRFSNLTRMQLATILNAPPTVFLVGKVDTNTNTTVMVGVPVSNTGLAGFYFQLGTNSSPFPATYQVSPTTTTFNTAKSTFPGLNTLGILTGVYDSTNTTNGQKISTNGSLGTTAAGGSQLALTGTFIGNADWYAGSFGNAGGNVDLCEIIAFNSVLTSAQQQQVEQYLTWKWGLPTANLPTGHPGKLLPAFGTAFTPKSVAGMALWLDGADTSSITGTSTVTVWNDKSGNGYHMNTLPANGSYTSVYPAIGTKINGLNTVFFSAYAGLKQATTLSGVKNLYWVGRLSRTGTSVGSCYNLLGHDTFYDWHGGNYGTTLYLNSTFTEAGIKNATPVSIYGGNTAVVNTTFISLLLPADGTINMISAAGITDNTYTRYQGVCYDRDNQQTGWVGDLAEVLIFSQALTTAQHQQVEGYLAWKWGLQSSLPSTHAYAKFSP